MQTTRDCSVTDCGKFARTKNALYCDMHYRKWLLYGDPLASRLRTRGACSIEECPGTARIRGLCEMHDGRVRRHGTTDFVGQVRGPEHHNWRAVVSYQGIHRRLMRIRGAAKNYDCAHCEMKALDWCYDHRDPDEISPDLRPYSLDVQHYLPLCRLCHRAFDRFHRTQRSA